MNNCELGTIGENMAAEILRCKGYEILRRNYRCPMGEIDIIAGRQNEISFVEVKTRQSFRYGRPGESITAKKRLNIRRAAQYFMKEININQRSFSSIDFQVLEITIIHTQNAF